ncbi:DUF4651 domain-containing protein [Streptococcus pseudoporcinus]|uniref:DUF4651 domain-containing protein n=2 Tax=Streptococcus pseudoporcinus TaxID=361101 RepID=G5KA00_9STRE|nr:DUF4651 domain-containing protein [Streptococcus pseudoporcinus]EFR43712.1 hypothetical protein HMPREF9320_1178 [Streptococcus pseudoporcinus SPIN 20026]EHI64068.1 hypothetical protein STRPS_0820 [Streptococcus pseudoporcinus LQ 940-04]VEF93742.1 membrane protein [Streptococcus pseudoporcinus]
MNKKRIKNLLGLAGISAIALLGLTLKNKYEDYQRDKMTADLRRFFSEMGQIDVLYFNAAESEKDCHKGGLVFADGRAYRFSYSKGDIVYEEETYD